MSLEAMGAVMRTGEMCTLQCGVTPQMQLG
jgi:hypothetical protein